jgi:hypothetical protein
MRKPALLASILALAFTGAAEAHKLKLKDARQAAQKEADAFAGQPARITAALRTSNHRYYLQAQWEKPGPPPYYFTQFCSAELTAKFKPRKSKHVRATVDSFACF